MINVVGAAEPIAPSVHTPEIVVAAPPTEPVEPSPLANPDLPPSPSAPLPSTPLKKAPDRKKMQLIIGAIFLLLLIVGGSIAMVLTKTNQDLRQQASGGIEPPSTGLRPKQPSTTPVPTSGRITLPTQIPRQPTGKLSTTPVPTSGRITLPTQIPRQPTGKLSTTPVPTLKVLGDPMPNQTPIPTKPLTNLSAVLSPTVEPTSNPTNIPNNPAATSTPATTPTLGANTNLGAGLTPTPTLVKTTVSCNESCTTTDNCRNPSHICSEGRCRLESNPTDTNCRLPSGGTQIALDPTQASRVYTPDAEPSGTTPVSGPADWLLYLKVGAGFLGLGTLALLFL